MDMNTAIQNMMFCAFQKECTGLNNLLSGYKEKIRNGSATDEDISAYNETIDQLVVVGSERTIPDIFWTMLSDAVGESISEVYPKVLSGTTYIRYKMDHNGVQVQDVTHQRRDGRPPTSYQLVVDGEPMRRRDFLLQYCAEPDNRISWSRVKEYAKELVQDNTFQNIELRYYHKDGREELRWALGVAVAA